MTLFLAFTLVPAIEIYLLIQIGQVIGGLETFFVIILTGIVGANLARTQGFALLRKIEKESQQGFPQSTTVAEGILILIGGILLITPGVVTDLAGLLFIFPLSRRLLAPRVLKGLQSRAQIRYGGGQAGWPPPAQEVSFDSGDQGKGEHFKHPVK
jgi:UPF0716 protein FxsA